MNKFSNNHNFRFFIYIEVTEYKAIDILKDPILRASVKKYSDWNTYPQLYVGGNLVGGSDILKDMHAEGSLKDLFIENGVHIEEAAE